MLFYALSRCSCALLIRFESTWMLVLLFRDHMHRREVLFFSTKSGFSWTPRQEREDHEKCTS